MVEKRYCSPQEIRSSMTKIGAGLDTTVYRLGGVVYKCFDRNRPPAGLVSAYVSYTNKAAQLGMIHCGSLNTDSRKYEVVARTNPIIGVYMSENVPIVIAPYSLGIELSSIYSRQTGQADSNLPEEPSQESEQLRWLIIDLQDRMTRERFDDLFIRGMTEMRRKLDLPPAIRFSNYPEPVSIKVRLEQPSKVQVIFTDFVGSVRLLGKELKNCGVDLLSFPAL